MNERIKELAREAGLLVHNPEGVPTKLEKFAELIVLKCVQIVETEAAQYAAPVWAVELINDMHEHFGVERDHIDNETCWCEPELDYTDPDTGVSVYVHRRVQ